LVNPAVTSIPADFLITNATSVVTCAGPAPRIGRRQGDVSALADAVLAGYQGRIVFVGSRDAGAAAVRLVPDGVTLNASGCTVIPGFVDPHTHAVYAGDRRHELRKRLSGASYAEIAAEGGGILSTVTATRAADEEQLVRESLPRFEDMLRSGTTTCEVKSGYGLDVESELRTLRAIARLGERQPIEISPTFLGAHEVPPEYRSQRQAYVDLVINRMMPAVAASGLAEWCDVFCDEGFFTVDESRDILLAGRAAGFGLRLHADELAASGGSLLAAEMGARSADHLLFATDGAATALAEARVVATLLPVAAFYLKLGRYAPARALIDAGVAVALATDVNPGGGFSPSMPFAMALACFAMNMTLEESLLAATLNAAYSLDRHHRVGSLEVGKQMDAVVVQGDLIDLVRVGVPAIKNVIKKGVVV
jgi:imidazolonepropionase